MLYFEKEANLIDFFRHIDASEICLIPQDSDTIAVAASLKDPHQWSKWVDK